MPCFEMARRVRELPPYLFAEIDRAKNKARESGLDIISLGIGDPDTPTPDFIIKALQEAATKGENHRYPSYAGLPAFRRAVTDWYARRFGVADLAPETEALGLIGSKEGIAHFPLAFIDPGDLALVCTPNYPVYDISVKFAGGQVEYLPLTRENDFLPDLDSISPALLERAKAIYLNYPNNPTAATATREFYQRAIELALRHKLIIVHDTAYTEIYYDPANKPMSIMELPGAKETAIEFHSLSKTFNMTGWRIGMAVGNACLVAGLGKIKENMDSGIFQAVQEAGIAALSPQGDAFNESLRAMYLERRDAAAEVLNKLGLEFQLPKATFYMWVRTPAGRSSASFVTNVLEKTGVVLTPGNGFGQPGEGWFRISLTVPAPRIKEALERLTAL